MAIGSVRGAQTVIGRSTHSPIAHAGRAEQEEDISAEIVATHELLLEELILFGVSVVAECGRSVDILAQQQVGQSARWLVRASSWKMVRSAKSRPMQVVVVRGGF